MLLQSNAPPIDVGPWVQTATNNLLTVMGQAGNGLFYVVGAVAAVALVLKLVKMVTK